MPVPPDARERKETPMPHGQRLSRNEEIAAPTVRVVEDEYHRGGVMPTHEALAHARALGLDLVLVAPNGRPPCCKLVDRAQYPESTW